MFKQIIVAFILSVVFAAPVFSSEAGQHRKQKTLLFRDVYETNVHAEAVNQLDFGRLGRKLFRKPLGSQNINIYDEVPDSAFFTNRHARKALSSDELKKGYVETDGPDLSQDLIITKGKSDGLHPGFFVKDARGDSYLVKFDPAENLELASGAEVVASRFYHALGYNVPQYTVALITPEKLKVGEGAKIRDNTGFLKPLTPEKLEETLMFVPQTADGQYRVSASKILSGENLGYFSFSGRRKQDPDDIINHRDRREVRALVVFGAWLNNNDVRENNTLDMLVQEKDRSFVKHYLIDFNGALGSAHKGAKPPQFGHEHMMDFGETAKAFFTLGLIEKPWQKRWRLAGEKAYESAAVGYLDNRLFDAGKYKAQLPYEAFKRLTRADGFWAAKQIAAFRDDDIRAVVSAGQYSASEDADYIAKTLIERRDLIAQYWFSHSAPLDDFRVEGNKLVFKDLAVEYGYAKPEERNYIVKLLNAKGKVFQTALVNETALALKNSQQSAPETVEIRTSENGPYVRVSFNGDGIVSVRHQD